MYQCHKYFYMHCAIQIVFIVLNSFHFSKLLFAIFKFMITTFYQVKGRRNTSIIFIPSYNQVMRKYVHFVTPKNILVQRKSNFCVYFSTFYRCNFCCYLMIMPYAHNVSLWMLFMQSKEFILIWYCVQFAKRHFSIHFS